MIELFPMFQLLLQARQVVTTVRIKAMMQVPSGPFHIQHLSAIIFFSSVLGGEGVLSIPETGPTLACVASPRRAITACTGLLRRRSTTHTV